MSSGHYDFHYDVKKADKHLKLGTGEDEEGLCNDNVICVPHILHVFICMLFKAMGPALLRWLLVL